ncbi:MAG: hypothetical protein L3J31_06005 [Bacteroidales bacterium]|nr:hypothetical protein [Bacteroidales bacterium]
MRKSLKISLTVLSFLVFGLLLLYAFRNELADFAIRKIAAYKSDNKVKLILEKVDFDPFHGSLSIYRPSLNFSDVYLNQKKGMQVNHLSFEKLGVYNVSVVDLLFNKRFVADKILVLKPSVHFEKHMTEEADTSQFSPDKLLSLLNTNSKTFASLRFNIKEIEIGYGSFNLHMDTLMEYAPDKLDFTILLKGFVTQDKTNVPVDKRILYSDEVIFRLKNISKQFNSDYDLHIDSLSYNSRLERITSDGLSLIPVRRFDKNKDKSSVLINRIRVDGLGVTEIRGKEKLHLSAVEFSGITLNTRKKTESDKQNQVVIDSAQLKKLPNIFDDFSLDSLIVNQFAFFNLKGDTDTVLAVENIGLLINEIAFDSTLLEDPLRLLQMGEIRFSTEKLKLTETEKGITLAYSDFNYSSQKKQLEFKQVQVFSDSIVFPGPQLKLVLPALQVSGFSVHDLLHKKKQILSLKLKQAIVQIGLQQQTAENMPATDNKSEYLELLEFQNFSIENSSLHLYSSSKFSVDFNGINMETTGFSLMDGDSTKQLEFDDLRFDLESISAILSGGNDRVKTGQVVFDNQYFEVSSLQAGFNHIVDKQRVKGEFALRKLQLSAIDLNSLLFDGKFCAGKIIIDMPVLQGYFPLPDSTKANKGRNEQSPFNLPLSFQIGEISLRQGRLDLSLEKADDTIRVQSNVDLQLGALVSNDSSFINWLNPSDWEVVLSEIDLASSAYDLCANRVRINPRQSLFELHQLNLLSKPHAKHLQNQFEIEKVSLPEIRVFGLDYKLLIQQDSIRFSKLAIENPDLSLRIFHQEKDTNSGKKSTRWKAPGILNIVYDTISLRGLHMKLDKHSDSSHVSIAVHNLSIEHLPGTWDNSNLLQRTAFQIDEFSVRDTLAHTFLSLNEIAFVPELTALTIRDVNWSKTANSLNKGGEIQEGDMSVHSSKIVFSGTFLGQTLPSRLSFDKLRFFDVDVTVTGGSKKESDQERELDFNLKALKKYSDLLSRLAIDTTVFDDVSVHFTTFDGLSQHTIKADSIGLVINRLDIDTNMFDQKNPILINNLIIDLNGRTRISNDSLYEIQTGRIHYNFPEHQITIDSFYILPPFDEAECFRRAKYQKGIIQLFGKKVELNDLRIEELLNDNELHFGGIDVFDLKFNIVKDKKYPIEPGTYKKMPQDVIRDIVQRFRVDSVRVFNSYIYFKLYPEKKTNKPGEIMLTNLNATAYNFTNIIGGEESPTFDILLNADIMGESHMDADFHFPLYDTANHWWFGFKTEKIDFVKLNSMTQNLVGLTILKGKGTVDAPLIRGDNFNTTGTMIFRYRRMRLSLYNRKKAETETGLFSSMANFFINDLVLKSNNPKFARKPRFGHVYTVRNTQKTIVNFAFRSLLSGMLSTLGINKKEQRKERKVYKKEEKQK